MPDHEALKKMAMRLAVLHFRMQCRVDAIMERAGGNFKAACEGPGAGISYLLTKECADAASAASKLLYKLIEFSGDGEPLMSGDAPKKPAEPAMPAGYEWQEAGNDMEINLLRNGERIGLIWAFAHNEDGSVACWWADPVADGKEQSACIAASTLKVAKALLLQKVLEDA